MPDAIALSPTARAQVAEIAARSGRPPAVIVERAVAELHRREFWRAADAGYSALRADPTAWAEEEADRRAWDATIADGNPSDESYPLDRPGA
jgi:hypothetical protein